MKIQLIFLLLIMSMACRVMAQDSVYTSENKLDINNATLEEIEKLPVSRDLAKTIYERITYKGPLESIFELNQIPGVTSDMFGELRKVIAVRPLLMDEDLKRVEDNYYKIERWANADEGTTENLVDHWYDQLTNPVNINKADYFGLINLPNVSPIDAAAIIRHIKTQDEIKSRSDLRGVTGLGSFAFNSIDDFVVYKDPNLKNKLSGHYTWIYKSIPFISGSSDNAEDIKQLVERDTPWNSYHKARLTYGNQYKAGFAAERKLGQEMYFYKGYLSIEAKDMGFLTLNRLVFGNYLASFGHGVVMENTDFFSSRKSGYGFEKRPQGIFGDISRSNQYTLRGVAAEASAWRFRIAGFISSSTRDAVINPDSSFSAFIVMTPRVRYGLSSVNNDRPNEMVANSMLNAVKEVTYGGHANFTFAPGINIGATIYESLYDRPLIMQTNTFLNSDGRPKFLNDFGNTCDPEIAASYNSRAKSSFWKNAKASRSVYGIDFTYTYKNFVLSGEHGRLIIPDSVYKDQVVINNLPKTVKHTINQRDPQATVLLLYSQFRTLNFLILYRNYDLKFDNPYQRSFSNYARFKSTIFEDEFYLADNIYSEMWSTSHQPQAERGIYTNVRYQVSEKWLTGMEYDTWTRVADNARYFRWVTRLEHRPLFNLRIQARNKFQSRGSNPLTPLTFLVRESIVNVIYRLSRFDEMTITYFNGFTEWPSRPRLSDAPGGDGSAGNDQDTPRGNAGSPGDMIGVQWTHFFSNAFKVMGSVKMYKGFFWTFEDTDFRVFNAPNTANRFWIAAFARVSPNLSLRLKYSFDHQEAQTGVQDTRIGVTGVTDFRTAPKYSSPMTIKNTSDVRFQMDYTF